MFPAWGLPPNQTCWVEKFFGQTPFGSNNRGNAVWIKPRGSTMLWVLLVGAGAGGAAGTQGVAGTNRNGGAGGGGAAWGQLLIPTILLPDRIYVHCGTPGLGGVVGGAAPTSGEGTGIYAYSSQQSGGEYIASVNGGSAPSGSTGGNGGSITTNATSIGLLGFWTSSSGDNGITSNTGGGSSSTTNDPFTGGQRGGGINSSDAETPGGTVGSTGGDFPPQPWQDGKIAAFPTGGAAGSAGNGHVGGDGGGGGIYWPGPGTAYFFCSGGAGGGSGTTSSGRGGDGGPGCGGGGGGAGVAAGNGGRGGPGMAIFVAW